MVRLIGAPSTSLTPALDRDLGAGGEYLESAGILDVIGLDDAAVVAWLAARGLTGLVLPDANFGDWATPTD